MSIVYGLRLTCDLYLYYTVLALLGRVSGRDTAVRMPGGLLRVTVDQEAGRVRNLFLTGPTNMVCEGEITDEELGEALT